MTKPLAKMNEDYGLPEVEMKPIDRAKPVVPAAAAATATTATKKRKEKEPTNYWPIILLILFFTLIAGGALYYFFLRSPANSEIADTTPPDRLPLEDEVAVPVEEPAANADNGDANVTDAAALNLDQPGTVTSITDRTGRYYIFLGSYKFRSYAKRHADQLAKDGFAVKLIEQDDWVGMRVAVGNYGSEAEAQADAASITAKYGTKIAISQY